MAELDMVRSQSQPQPAYRLLIQYWTDTRQTKTKILSANCWPSLDFVNIPRETKVCDDGHAMSPKWNSFPEAAMQSRLSCRIHNLPGSFPRPFPSPSPGGLGTAMTTDNHCGHSDLSPRLTSRDFHRIIITLHQNIRKYFGPDFPPPTLSVLYSECYPR